MHSTLSNNPIAPANSRCDHGTRSWLPMQPHLLVAVDPLRWSKRARTDQRWQPAPGAKT